jgi:hypothetical protein
MELFSKILLVITLTIAFLSDSYAQEHSIGTSWSFSGIGLTYDHQVKETAFVHVGAQLEMTETFIGRARVPGGSVSFTWNDILGSTTSRNGNRISFFTGAGAAAGYCKDFRVKRIEQVRYGSFFGLKGRAGVRIEYDRNINITAAIAPVLGMHLFRKEETVMMRYYRYGLLQTLMPELTISYRF